MKTFAIKAFIRPYTFKVTLHDKTLRVKQIEAGCRQWKSFDEAFKHYSVYTGAFHYRLDYMRVHADRHAWRLESRAILGLLHDKVGRARQKRREAMAAARKAKRKAK